MTKFQIYTEKKDNLQKLVDQFFGNATLIEASGIYHRKSESTVIIEIIELDDFWYHNSRAKVDNLVKLIKDENEQECVLVTEQKLRAKVV